MAPKKMDIESGAAALTPITVRLPRSVAYDLRKFQKVQESILGRLGCHGCCSGFDIHWDFTRVFTVDEQLKITEPVQGIIEG